MTLSTRTVAQLKARLVEIDAQVAAAEREWMFDQSDEGYKLGKALDKLVAETDVEIAEITAEIAKRTPQTTTSFNHSGRYFVTVLALDEQRVVFTGKTSEQSVAKAKAYFHSR